MLLQLSLARSEAAYQRGDLDLAEDYAQRAVDLGRIVGAEDIALVRLPAINLERGRTEVAATLIESVEIPQSTLWGAVLQAERGRIRIARGDLTQGLEDLFDAAALMDGAGYSLSVDVDWTTSAAQALVGLGRTDQAIALAHRELEAARAFGAPRHGIALSLCGSLEPGAQGLAWLQEAVAILAPSAARLAYARALVNLGIGLRARHERTAAREALAQGLDVAHRQGAWGLAELARAELIASGARPRRALRSGPQALTPAELRVARMAAEGHTNRQIAQALFLATKTVEGQLSQAYAKLGIGSRDELSDALGGSGRTAVRRRHGQ